ncbi:hypothetical protein C6V83_03090 [Gordonia iterans]|uniref:Uncharacterized protein n=1 Tax=Gordonia iterans TaxID=1004901 RepID=A0A2S0KCN3_9ACTN|nr:hypothetical protein [Gordonia iterans]AVL99415.1 hypothetical protein C6V83_03090 [Gordonia iterans]
MTAPASRRPAWLDDFTVPASAAGAVLAFDFGDDGLWAARVDRRLDVEETVMEPRITPAVLDVRIASYLRDSETVPDADRPAVFAELTDVCRRARHTLIERDSVLLMGTEHLRLVTVSLDTAMAATVPEVNRAHGMIVELAGREPVAAVLLGPGTDSWPGLWESLTARGFAMLLPGDAFPATFGGDDDRTDVLESVDDAPTALAWAAAAPETPTAFTQPPAPRRRRHRRQVMGTAAALAVVALAGTAVAVTVVNDEDDPGTDLLATPASSDPTGAEPTPETSPSTVAPDDLRAARAQMKRYTPPTSSSSAAPSTSEARPGTPPRPRPRPNPRRTIPNPIPGLPPIIIG